MHIGSSRATAARKNVFVVFSVENPKIRITHWPLFVVQSQSNVDPRSELQLQKYYENTTASHNIPPSPLYGPYTHTRSFFGNLVFFPILSSKAGLYGDGFEGFL